MIQWALFDLYLIETLHKKWSFPLRISSVNVAKFFLWIWSHLLKICLMENFIILCNEIDVLETRLNIPSYFCIFFYLSFFFFFFTNPYLNHLKSLVFIVSRHYKSRFHKGSGKIDSFKIFWQLSNFCEKFTKRKKEQILARICETLYH